MARFNGGVFSKTKGKLAGLVFQQYEGMQVGKEYQPNVKNPNSAGQVEQRARFKLASQLLATFQEVLVIAAANISPYIRMVRGRLVAAIRAASTYSGDRASINLEGFVSAVNGLHYNAVVPAPVITGAAIGSATITAPVDDVVEYTIVALDENGENIGSKTERYESEGTAHTILAPLTSGTPDSYRVVAVAMRQAEGVGSPIYSNIMGLNRVSVSYGVSSGAINVSPIAAADLE